MQDELKGHIEKHIDETEVYSFDVDQGWRALENELAIPLKSNRVGIWRSIAASLTILLICALGIIYMQASSGAQYSDELTEIHTYYQKEISQRVALVRDQPGGDLLMQDLSRLDEAMSELSVDLEDEVHNEEVISAMISNYRLKLRILEDMLEELDKESDESYPTM